MVKREIKTIRKKEVSRANQITIENQIERAMGSNTVRHLKPIGAKTIRASLRDRIDQR